MQDVTDLTFMRVIAHYGAPDYFFTEFFRVHSQSRLEKHIVRCLDDNTTGRPIFAQVIGEDLEQLVRTARELQQHPIAGIDLNLGCPAPKVYKKNVGGGLLRDLAHVDRILGALRAATPGGLFTVKMRIGFDDTTPFEPMLDLVNAHRVDLLSVHGRTVKEMYRSRVHYDFIARAVQRVRCPVLANGNVTSAPRAVAILRETGAAGVMIGRHAIRNPWIFRQCRELFHPPPALQSTTEPSSLPATAGATSPACFRPTFADVRDYIAHLYQATQTPGIPERIHVSKMKKYLNFVGQAVDPTGAFLREMRRAESEAELFRVCDRHLLPEPAHLIADEPYEGVIARPNCETPHPADRGSPETISA